MVDRAAEDAQTAVLARTGHLLAFNILAGLVLEGVVSLGQAITIIRTAAKGMDGTPLAAGTDPATAKAVREGLDALAEALRVELVTGRARRR